MNRACALPTGRICSGCIQLRVVNKCSEKSECIAEQSNSCTCTMKSEIRGVPPLIQCNALYIIQFDTLIFFYTFAFLIICIICIRCNI